MRWHLVVVAVLLGLAGTGMLATTSGLGASAPVTVTATVPSSSSITDQCQDPAAYNFGTVLPGSAQLTSTSAGTLCRFLFSSSNNSAMLRLSQRDRLAPTAMASVAAQSTQVGKDPPVTSLSANPANGAEAYAIVEGGKVWKTLNSGTTWTQMTDTTRTDCTQVSTISTLVAWSACNDGTVIKTTDGAATWVPTTAKPCSCQLTAIGASGTTVWAGTGGGVWKSTDSGATWAKQTVNFNPGTWYNTVVVISPTIAWAAGTSEGEVMRTTDGTNWTALTPVGWSGGCNSFTAADATNAFIGCDGGHIERTTNGTSLTDVTPGGDWESVDSIHANSATSIIATLADGQMLRSTNGTSWSLVTPSPTTDNLWTSSGAGTTFYAGGQGSNIAGSTDSGVTWAVQKSAHGAVLGLAADGVQRAWEVGGFGQVSTTTDGGTTWTPRVSGTTVNLRGVAYAGGGIVVAVGDGGKIIRSTDDGVTWANVASGTTNQLNSVAAGDDGFMWAAGKTGTILRSSDSGATWQDRSTGAADFRSISAYQSNVAWAVGNGGTVVRTLDGGLTWASKAMFTGNWNYHAAVSVVDANTVYVGGGWDSLYVTHDGGTSWAQGTPSSAVRPLALSAVSRDVAFATSVDANVFRTTDGGVTWNALSGGDWIRRTGLAAVDSNTAFTGGNGGYLDRTSPSVPVTDYGAGSNWGSGASTNTFGVCLQAVGGTTTAAWTPDTFNTPGKCETLDTDPWYAVPTTPTKIASTAGPGVSGQVDLVWGVRPKDSLAAGTYSATVLVEVVAPAV